MGPREDQVKGSPGFLCVMEYSAFIISGETKAPIPETGGGRGKGERGRGGGGRKGREGGANGRERKERNGIRERKYNRQSFA